MEIYFFDSYALIEFLVGNPNYEKYKNEIVLLTKLNLFEVYYWFLRTYGKKEAELFLKKYYSSTLDFDGEIISKAAEMKIFLKKRSLSMADCIGYCLARSWDIKFLTGDKEFEYFQGVEFVK